MRTELDGSERLNGDKARVGRPVDLRRSTWCKWRYESDGRKLGNAGSVGIRRSLPMCANVS